MALSAHAWHIAQQFQTYAGIWTVAGVSAGLIVSLALARTIRGLLFGVSPYDLVSLGLASSLMMVVATLAALVPSLRAARVDPNVALRHE